jgi:hypothetical protein
VEEGVIASSYYIVCVIHGDGEYLYHDTSGNEYSADEEALAGAMKVAQQNPLAEVFIFHQRSRKNFLFVFPLHDGEFFYYRNGRLIANELYWRDQEKSQFGPEVGLYRRFRGYTQRESVNMFLYYGHEIPECGGANYHASYPDRTFTVDDLTVGLRGFMQDSTRYDLMILSRCFGGTPFTIGTLGPLARYIIASPDNLHLSYFDLQALERLDLSVRDRNVPVFAKRFARQAFDRLTNDIQTAVSVAVYDVDRVQEYIRSVRTAYHHTFTTEQGRGEAINATIEHCDCAELPAFERSKMSEGVDLLYRPPRFGRSKNKQIHSGWECPRENRLETVRSETTEPAVK